MKNIPIIEVDCGDFAIEYAGGEFHPHEGEKVWFVPYLSMPDMISLMALTEAGEDKAFQVLKDEVAPVLASVIDRWTWTHVVTDAPLGKQYNGTFYKPSAEDVAALSHQEIMYLTNGFFKATRAKEDVNPQPAS